METFKFIESILKVSPFVTKKSSFDFSNLVAFIMHHHSKGFSSIEYLIGMFVGIFKQFITVSDL